MATTTNLMTEFSEPSPEDWRAFAEKSMRGKPLDPVLTTSGEGLDLPAFVARADRPERSGPATARHGDWRIGVRHSLASDTVNADILEDLRGGASAVTLTLNDAVLSAETLNAAFDGVYREMVTLSFDGLNGATAKTALSALGEGKAFAELHLGLDPLGDAAAGRDAGDLPSEVNTSDLSTFYTVNGCRLYNHGASSVTEVAATLAIGLAYLRHLVSDGLTTTEASKLVRFSLAADTDFFACLAKFRAFQNLWRGMLTDCCVENPFVSIEARQTLRSQTMREPATNAIRLSIAGMAAGLGGADAVTLNGFKGSDEASRRLSRNAQLMLLEESHLGRVSDPAYGSYALESWTEKLMDAAWSKLQSLEAIVEDGGNDELINAVRSFIESDKAARDQKILSLEKGVIAVTRYPDLGSPIEAGDHNPFSLTAAFERCLAASDAFYETEGHRPGLFLSKDAKGLQAYAPLAGFTVADAPAEADVSFDGTADIADFLEHVAIALENRGGDLT